MKGVIEYELDRPREAYATLIAALERAKGKGGSCARARTLTDLGNVCYHLGAEDEAESFYEEALHLEQVADHKVERAGVLNLLGRLHDKLGRTAEAEACYGEALDLHTGAGNAVGRAGSLRNLSKLQSRKGAQAEAICLLEVALEIYDRIGHQAGRADTLKEIGRLKVAAGAIQPGLEALRYAVAAYRELRDLSGLAECLLTLGRLLPDLGQGKAAAGCFEEAEAASMAAVKGLSRAEALSMIARIGLARGEAPGAMEAGEMALEEWEAGGEARAAAKALVELGDATLQLRKPNEALARYGEALSLYGGQGDQRGAAEALFGVARSHRAMERHALALQAACEAIVLAESGGEPQLRVSILLEEADILHAMGRPEEGERAAEQGGAMAAGAGLPLLHASAERKAAHLAAVRGDADRAEVHFLRALDAIEDVGNGCHDSDLKVRYFDERQQAYEDLITHLMARGRAREALEASERSRARAFRDLTRGFCRSTNAMPLTRASTAGPAARNPSNTRFRCSRLKTATLVYHCLERSTILWLLDGAGRLESRVVPVARASLAGRIARLSDLLEADRSPVRGPGAEDSQLATELRDLYRLLIEPIEAPLGSGECQVLCIVPHGPLYELPFAALLDGHQQYLIEKFSVSFALCLSQAPALLPSGARSIARRTPPLVVGDPVAPQPCLARLPGARREAEAVAGILMERAGAGSDAPALLLDAGATEEAFRTFAPQMALIHLAAHGLAREAGQWSPTLFLGQTGPEPRRDGRLTPEEVQGMALRADLVVLSGCETARGELTSDGALGLPRSFLAAGAQSVLASLWRVKDTISTGFALAFYRALTGSVTKAEALRAAQLELLRQDGAGWELPSPAGDPCGLVSGARAGPTSSQVPPRSTSHPASWAGFVLYGAAE